MEYGLYISLKKHPRTQLKYDFISLFSAHRPSDITNMTIKETDYIKLWSFVKGFNDELGKLNGMTKPCCLTLKSCPIFCLTFTHQRIHMHCICLDLTSTQTVMQSDVF